MAKPIEHPAVGRRKQDVAKRWRAVRDYHKRQSDYFLAGLYLMTFSDADETVLDAMGFLSQHDKRIFKAVRTGRTQISARG